MIRLKTIWCIAIAAVALLGLGKEAEASHFRGGTLTYENLGPLNDGGVNNDWIVIKATLTLIQRGSAHCGATIPAGEGGTGNDTLSCCDGSGLPSGCVGRWRGAYNSQFTWGAGGQPHPTLSVSTPAFMQPTGQTADAFIIGYMEVIAENTAQDFLVTRLDLYRIYPPATAMTTATWGSCCWAAGILGPSTSNYTLQTTIPVSGGNQAPRFNHPLALYACSGSAFTFDLGVVDPEGDPVQVTLTPTTGGADQQTPPLTVSSTGVVSWSSPLAGAWAIQLNAADDQGTSAASQFVLNVQTCTTTPPVATLAPPSQMVTPETQACTDVTLSDADTADTLTVTALPALPGVVLAPATALDPNQTNPFMFSYCWTPTTAHEQSYDVLFTVTDNGNPPLTSQSTATFEVQAAPAPTITLDPVGVDKTVEEGQCLTFTATAADASGIDTFVAGPTALPSFCTETPVVPDGISLECCPAIGETGTYMIDFTATDLDPFPKNTLTTVNLEVTMIPVPDAGVPDAGVEDSGVADAGVEDAAVDDTDAAANLDAGGGSGEDGGGCCRASSPGAGSLALALLTLCLLFGRRRRT